MSSSRKNDSASKDKRRKGKEKETAPISTSLRPSIPASRKNSAASTPSTPAASKPKKSSKSAGEPEPSHRSHSKKRTDSVQRAQSGHSYLSERRGSALDNLEQTKPQGSPKKLLTLLINDTRYQDPQLEEIWINLRTAPGIDGLWADALEVTDLLQGAPGRIEGPAKVYAKRQGFRQIFLTVSVDGTYSCKPTNLQVLDGRSLQLWVEKWTGDPELMAASRPSERFHPYPREKRGVSRDDLSPSDFPGRASRSDVSYLRTESPRGKSSTPESLSAVPASSHDSPQSETSHASHLSYIKTSVARPPSRLLTRDIGGRRDPSPPLSSVVDMDISAYDSPAVLREAGLDLNPDWAQSDEDPEPPSEPEPAPKPTPKPAPKPVPKRTLQDTPNLALNSTPKPKPQPKARGPSKPSEPASQPISRPKPTQPTPARTPQQEARPPSLTPEPSAPDLPSNRIISGGFGAFSAPSPATPTVGTPRSTSGFAAFAPRATSGGFAAFASSPAASPSVSSPIASAFGAYATPPASGIETHAKPRRWLADKSGPGSTQDAMIEYVTGLLDEDPGWAAFESDRRLLIPMVRYIEHLRWQKSALDRLNGQPIPVEVGVEPGTTITPELMMAVYHAQPSYENILNNLLGLADLYGPGAPHEDPQVVAAFNEIPVTTPMHQVKKCLQVLEEVDARAQGSS